MVKTIDSDRSNAPSVEDLRYSINGGEEPDSTTAMRPEVEIWDTW